MLSKIFLACFTCLICFNYTFCQSGPDEANKFEKMAVEKISGKKESFVQENLPFKNIEVVDARADTSFIGFYEGSLKRTFKLNFENGLAGYATNFYQKKYAFQSSGNETPGLLLCIRKFWASPSIDTTKDEETEPLWAKGIIVKIEAYTIFDNEYYAVSRSEFYDFLPSIYPTTIEEHTKNILTKIVSELIAHSEKLAKGKKPISRQQIEKFNSDPINLRILKDEALAKGAYNTFEEFKNNNPFYKNYDLQNGSLGDMIFVKDNEGKEFPARNVWGYCDGRNAYMKMADNYFKLERSGNTFILFGAKQLTRRRRIKVENVLLLGLAAGGTGKQNKRTTYSIITKPYQLDLMDGEVY